MKIRFAGRQSAHGNILLLAACTNPFEAPDVTVSFRDTTYDMTLLYA